MKPRIRNISHEMRMQTTTLTVSSSAKRTIQYAVLPRLSHCNDYWMPRLRGA